MTAQKDIKDLNLENPGAGLPLFQRWIVRYVLGGIASRHSDWGLDEKVFARTHQRILQLIQNINEDDIQKQILVKPIVGMEDSSRYWSIAMTLEHIVLVGEGVAKIITALSREEKLDIDVDIAAMKPHGNKPVAEILERFNDYSQNVLQQVDSQTADRDAQSTLNHPWFGEMNVRQWHWLLARHSGIHLKQIEQIVDILKQQKD